MMVPPNAGNTSRRSWPRWLPLVLLFGALPLALHQCYEPSAVRDVHARLDAPVVMYSTKWCPYCSRARSYFKRHGISYVEYDIEASAQNRAQFQALNGRGVPLIIVGDKRLQGFNPQSFEALLK